MRRPTGMRPPTVGPRGGAGDSGALTVDYRDVLTQAVQNERWRVLREVIAAVEAVPMTVKSSRNTWSTDPRSSHDVKQDIMAALNQMVAD